MLINLLIFIPLIITDQLAKYVNCENSYSAFTNIKKLNNFHENRAALHNFSRNLLNYKFEPYFHHVDDIVGEECKEDIENLIKDIGKRKKWALSVYDSWGPMPGKGIMEGNTLWLGQYDECFGKSYKYISKNNTEREWNNQYCLFNAQIIIKNFPTLIRYGSCLPKTCKENDLKNFINYLNLLPKFRETKITYTCASERNGQLKSSSITFLSILALYVTFIIVASCYVQKRKNKSIERPVVVVTVIDESANDDNDQNELINNDIMNPYANIDPHIVQEKEETSEYLLKFLSPFAVQENISRIFSVRKVEENTIEEDLLCLDGMRVLSILWVFTCHMYSLVVGFSNNPSFFVNQLKKFLFQIIDNGFFSVDSFFFLSGLLVSYLFLKEFKKIKNDSWRIKGKFLLKYYIHRYIRLVPSYAIGIWFSSTLFTDLYDRNFIPLFTPGNPAICGNDLKWWRNLLFINNYYPMNSQCDAWTWYLGADMQMFAIAPIFLLVAASYPIGGILLIIAGCLGACSINMTYYIIHPEWMMVPHSGIIYSMNMDAMNLYERFYTRFGPYGIGILLGILIHTYNLKELKIKFGKYSFLIIHSMHLFGILLSGILVFGLYRYFHNMTPNWIEGKTLPLLITYFSFHHMLWGVVLSLLVVAYMNDCGVIFRKFLSLPFFQILGKCTYSMYLIHYLILMLFISQLTSPLHLSNSLILVISLGLASITYLCSFIWILLFESPFIRLESTIRSWNKPKYLT
ncbi:hypothetical protein SNEBB_006161 [Seison nebaliae]|nr:hypothetical protein SNEBB_006161 [Seison nebaliae]